MQNDGDANVVFVYLGNPIPDYARHSLALSRRNFGGKMILITDQPFDGTVLEGVITVQSGSWYDPEPFRQFSEQSPLDELFRGGFWLRAVERFYVLSQFMERFRVRKLFHAELDVVLFDLEGVAGTLDQQGLGVFVPAQRVDRGIGDFVYVNDASALREMLDYFGTHVHLGNEMNILGSFLTARKDVSVRLPSEGYFAEPDLFSELKPSTNNIGLFDAQTFGTWILGYDPRNISGTSWNHFSEGGVSLNLAGFRFHSNLRGSRLWLCAPDGETFQIRCLHVHSKLHQRLVPPGALFIYVFFSNLAFRMPMVVRTDYPKSLILRKLLSRTMAKVYESWPGFVRLFLGARLVNLAASTNYFLSERQRQVLLRLMPKVEKLPSKLPNNDDDWFGTVEIVADFPEDVLELLDGMDENSKRGFAAQIGIFRRSLTMDTPAIFHRTGAYSFQTKGMFSNGKQVLLMSSEKDYLDSRHALAYWSEVTLNNRLSFTADYQLIQPSIVHQMFADGPTAVYEWAALGLRQPTPSLSAFQSYGIWLFSRMPERTILART